MPDLGIRLDWPSVPGYVMLFLISIIGFRLLYYFDSYFFHWRLYRKVQRVTNDDLRALAELPFVKIQVTTAGTVGSTEVIRRGIQNVVDLAMEAPELYGGKISVEVITMPSEQVQALGAEFAGAPIPVEILVVPPEYQTPLGTKLKARQMHWIVERRRQGYNRKPGRTFIVHYDEDSVMMPREMRKLIRYLATTDKKLTEGPIYYPLEYDRASLICQAMEANRPVGCFECREVMEAGTPLHLHGSNLVLDEELENDLGWDLGTLGGQAFIAEDFVFGMLAYLKEGPQVFGWHGAVMLEEPPFSLRSAFKQRYRWVLGTLQGLSMMHRMPEYHRLAPRERFNLIWGTRYRILTFALGLPTGITSLLYLLYQAWLLITGHSFLPLPAPFIVWLIIVGVLWINSLLIGVWYNLAEPVPAPAATRWMTAMRVLTVAPIAGVSESTAAVWAVFNWLLGNRAVSWQPTPKTVEADGIVSRGVA